MYKSQLVSMSAYLAVVVHTSASRRVVGCIGGQASLHAIATRGKRGGKRRKRRRRGGVAALQVLELASSHAIRRVCSLIGTRQPATVFGVRVCM